MAFRIPSSASYTCVKIGASALLRSIIFILVEVHQCQGLYMFKIRPQTDIVILEIYIGSMGRPSPALLTFRAQCKAHLFIQAFLQCK